MNRARRILPTELATPLLSQSKAWLLVILGGLATAYNLFRLWRGFTDRNWNIVHGEVDDALVVERPRRRFQPPKYEVVVRYHYKVEGARYDSDQTDYDGGDRYDSELSAREGAKEYRSGVPIEVHVDPANPARAVLKVGMGPSTIRYLVFSLIALGLGLWSLLGS